MVFLPRMPTQLHCDLGLYCRALVSVGAVGAAAPTDFEKNDFAPTKILENLTFDSFFIV